MKSFYRHIRHDFPAGEYAPYAVLYRQLEDGHQEGFVFTNGEQDLAYSICAVNSENHYVLISLFAVFEAFRSQGIGSEFLKSLQKRYARMQGIIVEVERPELSKTRAELDTAKRRISFYERAGFYAIKGIDYTIWYVPMDLMAYPINAGRDEIDSNIKDIMYKIYLSLVGRLFIGKMKLTVLK